MYTHTNLALIYCSPLVTLLVGCAIAVAREVVQDYRTQRNGGII